jgi:hypothetical protein
MTFGNPLSKNPSHPVIGRLQFKTISNRFLLKSDG